LWHYLHMSAGMQISLAERAGLVAEIFAMLAESRRVRIILADKNPAAVAQHLAKLRLARMVSARQDGTRVFYRLTDEHAARLVNEAFLQAEHSIGGVPAHHLDGGV
jgi:DNA-binding transcriptional ArsR family regulator